MPISSAPRQSRPSHPTGAGRLWEGLLCFLLPCGLLLVLLARLGVYPFGELTLLVADMNSEYIDYLAAMNRILREGGSLLRSWTMGMGLGMLGLIAFYTASPLYLLALLLPVEWLTEVVALILLIKVGLCGLTFSLLLGRTAPLPLPVCCALSTAYALMGYNIAYSSNLMWLDGVLLLPLVILGVERLLEQGRGGPLLWSLVFLFLTSYYIGYMVGLFALLYLVGIWLGGGVDSGKFLGALLRLAGCALLAAGCCAFLLLPAFFGLRSGQAALWGLQAGLTLQRPLVQVLSALLPRAFDTLTDSGVCNIYCTLAGVGGALLYFTNVAVPRREKLAYGGILLLLLLSFSCELLYLGWHAFEDPTWFPARFSFLFSFWLLFLTARGLHARDGIRPAGILGAAGLLLLLVLENLSERQPFLDRTTLLLTLLLLAIYVGIAFGAMAGPRVRLCALVLLPAVVSGEALWNGMHTLGTIDNRFHYRSRESYTAFREEFAPSVAALRNGDPGVYRVELVQQRNANGGLALGYPGISHYSTTTDQALNARLKALGYNTGTLSELRFTPNTPLTAGLLGIRYLLSSEVLADYEDSHLGEGIYANPLAFPLAHFADRSALEQLPAETDAFALQNRWIDSLWEGESHSPFLPLLAQERLWGMERREGETGLVYQNLSRGEAYVEWSISNPDRHPVYLFLPADPGRFTPATLQIGGMELRELAYRNNTVHYLGDEEELVVRLRTDDSQLRMAGAYFYALDRAAALAATEQAGETAVEFERFTDTRVSGTVSAPRAGAVVTTFPYDSGWRIRVDGNRVQPVRYAEGFLAWEVDAGDHTLELRYWPTGFLPGLLLSAATVLALLVHALLRRKRKKPSLLGRRSKYS